MIKSVNVNETVLLPIDRLLYKRPGRGMYDELFRMLEKNQKLVCYGGRFGYCLYR